MLLELRVEVLVKRVIWLVMLKALKWVSLLGMLLVQRLVEESVKGSAEQTAEKKTNKK